MNILEFAKKFTTFKPSPYHEALFKVIEESIEKGEKNKVTQFVDGDHYRWYKDLKLNEFIYSHMLKMTEGQTFAIVSPKGIHVFKKIEFRDIQGNKE